VFFVLYIEYFPYCLFVSNSQVIGCEDRLRNDLYCVGWGVKLYSIQSIAISLTSSQQVIVMEFWKRHDTTDFYPRQLVANLLCGNYGETGVMDFGKTYGQVADLLQGSRQLVMDFLWGNWCRLSWP